MPIRRCSTRSAMRRATSAQLVPARWPSSLPLLVGPNINRAEQEHLVVTASRPKPKRAIATAARRSILGRGYGRCATPPRVLRSRSLPFTAVLRICMRLALGTTRRLRLRQTGEGAVETGPMMWRLSLMARAWCRFTHRADGHGSPAVTATPESAGGSPARARTHKSGMA
jgi:hypothetical protein